MPAEIECAYLDQGYALPEGLTWEMVAHRRKRWDSPEIFVPIAAAPGGVGWARRMPVAYRSGTDETGAHP